MIRIDEIYNHTFWPYIKRHIPDTRMFFCFPFGGSQPEHLCNYDVNNQQVNYTFFYDQEPIHPDMHLPLFESLVRRNEDIEVKHCAIITSEKNSEFVKQVCSQFNLNAYYYFFHGWAALDWFRGYNRSYLIPDPVDRIITKSFISPNRIIGGKRQHRVDLMYHLLERSVKNAWISFPAVCPAEKLHISQIAKPNQCATFLKANLPWNFPNEENHPMDSCWLSLFDECSESLAYVITETVATGRRHHLTEKTFKPICLGMPFVMVGTAGSLKYLREYGFRTFEGIWDESYDLEVDDDKRLVMIADLLARLDSVGASIRQEMFESAIPIIKHNYNHFYSGGFESILWKELRDMLKNMQADFND